MSDPIALCLAGRISPEVALARLLLAGTPPEAIAAQVAARHTDSAAWRRLETLASRHESLADLSALLREVDHDPSAAPPETALAGIAALFDRAVTRAPEASVAAYSLGDPEILAAATAEIIAWLNAERLLGRDRDVLDLGCGIGRVAVALAPLSRSVLGLDVSPGMVAEARRRHASIPNLRFAVTPGTGLDLAAASLDLILAVDSFPYLVQAGGGLAERHMQDAARILRPGGALAILNLSYRDDPARDPADAARWAGEGGWTLALAGTTPFTLWDGRAFLLRLT